MRCCTLLALLLPAAVLAGEHRKHIEPTGTVRECLNLRSVRSTRVVDDQTVLFYLKNKTVYRSQLDSACPALAATGSFTYNPTANRLCHTDTITVLDRELRGATCSLGMFEEITETWGKPG